MSLVWLLKDPRVTSVLIGASSVAQLDDNVAALKNLRFSKQELDEIEFILSGKKESAPTISQIKTQRAEEKGNSRGDFIKNLATRFPSSYTK